MDGPIPIEILARVAARMGEPDRAIAALQKLLSIPYDGALAQNVPLTPALLRLDPMFDPLRNDPRFQKLCEEKAEVTHMPSEQSSDSKFEIGHVLFIDIVGYSKLLIEEQKERLNQLTKIVLGTAQVRDSTDEQLVRLPTGDGMALVFRHSAEEPARCALEIAEALRKHPEIPVRMGIHSGPVSEVTDVSGRTNLAGAGINMAQRVMDCGDAGHILLSQHVADDLVQYRQWAPRLRDLGECEVKHGVRLHLVNLYAEPLGNAAVPQKFQQTQRNAAAENRRGAAMSGWIAALVLVAILAGRSGILLFHGNGPKGAAIPEKIDRGAAAGQFHRRSG